MKLRWSEDGGMLSECLVEFDLTEKHSKVSKYVPELMHLMLHLGNEMNAGGVVKIRFMKEKFDQKNKYAEETLKQLDNELASTLPCSSDSSSRSWWPLFASPEELHLFVAPFAIGSYPRYKHSAWKRQERQKLLMTVDDFKQWQPSRCQFELLSPLWCDHWVTGTVAKLAESTRVELKREVNKRNPSELAKYICGFRNGDGGYLCIGVEETGVEGRVKLVGIDVVEADEIELILRFQASQFHPPVPYNEFVRISHYLDLPGRLIVVFCISPSQSKICTQLESPKKHTAVPLFDDSDPILMETRNAYFGVDIHRGIVDVISQDLVFEFGTGWRICPEFFRPSSPLRKLVAPLLLIQGHGILCQSVQDAKLIMSYLWRFGLIRISIGVCRSEAELEIAKLSFVGAEWSSKIGFVDNVQAMQNCVIRLGLTFEGLHRGDEVQLSLLTLDQARMLRDARSNQYRTKTVLIGPPGSGKTIAAIELIQDFVTESPVLYICANRPLADHVESRLRGLVVEGMWTVRVASDQFPSDEDLESHKFFIFDELQSYPNQKCWDFFKISKRNEIWALVDPSQAVRRSDSGLPTFRELVSGKFHYLTLNLVVRNGVELFKVTRNWAGRTNTSRENQKWIHSWRPHKQNIVEGSVEYLNINVLEAISHLLRDGAREAEIVILVPNVDSIGEICFRLDDAKVPWRREDGDQAKCVTVESVHRFKGLDRPFVIFVAPPPEPQHVATFVGAFSRAIIKCVVISPSEDMLGNIRRQVLLRVGEWEEMQNFFVSGIDEVMSESWDSASSDPFD